MFGPNGLGVAVTLAYRVLYHCQYRSLQLRRLSYIGLTLVAADRVGWLWLPVRLGGGWWWAILLLARVVFFLAIAADSDFLDDLLGNAGNLAFLVFLGTVPAVNLICFRALCVLAAVIFARLSSGLWLLIADLLALHIL
jgi:hypothetical protein